MDTDQTHECPGCGRVKYHEEGCSFSPTNNTIREKAVLATLREKDNQRRIDMMQVVCENCESEMKIFGDQEDFDDREWRCPTCGHVNTQTNYLNAHS